MRVNVTKSVAANFDDPFGKNVRLLVQVMVVLVRVVERTHWACANYLLQASLSWHLPHQLLHHFFQ